MSLRALVIDDSRTARQILVRSLSAVGIPCAQEAADGDEAVSLFKDSEFDLVLTDWNMPGKSGLEVLQAIRAIDPRVPVIVVTTESDQSNVVEAIQAGVTDYLVKPFNTETLRAKLERHGC